MKERPFLPRFVLYHVFAQHCSEDGKTHAVAPPYIFSPRLISALNEWTKCEDGGGGRKTANEISCATIFRGSLVHERKRRQGKGRDMERIIFVPDSARAANPSSPVCLARR